MSVVEDGQKKKRGGWRIVAVAFALLAAALCVLWSVYAPKVKEMAADAERISATAKTLVASEQGELDSIRHEYTSGRWVVFVEWHPTVEQTPEQMGAAMDRLWPKLKPHIPERYATTVLAVPTKKEGIEISTKTGPWHRYKLYRVFGLPLDEAR